MLAYALPSADQYGSSGVTVCGFSMPKNSMPVTADYSGISPQEADRPGSYSPGKSRVTLTLAGGCLHHQSPDLGEEFENLLKRLARSRINLLKTVAAEHDICQRRSRGASLTDSIPLDDHIHIVLVSRDAKRAGRAINEHAQTAFRDGLKIRSITYAKARQSIDFSGIGDAPFLHSMCSRAGIGSA